jgi:hypothetical protein
MDLGVIYYLVLAVLIIIAISYILYQLTQLYYTIHPRRTSFLPSPITKISKTLDLIIKKLKIKPNKFHFYELGSGTATVTNYIARNYKFKSYNAIESEFQTFLLTKIFRWLTGLKNVNFILGDFFKVKINKPALFYVLLSPSILNCLEIKDIFTNCYVISFVFQIPNQTPLKVYHIDKIDKDIFVYKFD